MLSPEANKEAYIHTINTTGYTEVATPLTQTDTDQLFAAFHEVTDICAIPDTHGITVAEAFTVQTPGRPADSKGFIERRYQGSINGKPGYRGPGTDNKDILHFTPRTAPQVEKRLASHGGVPVAVRGLLDLCIDTHHSVKESLRPVLGALGLADVLLASEGNEQDDVHILRLIRYAPTAADRGDVTTDRAPLHFDYSKITASITANSAGLIGGPAHNAQGKPNLTSQELQDYTSRALATPIPHNQGSLIVFAGAGYNHLPQDLREDSGDLPLFLHGVTNTRTDQERYAAVLFINQHAGIMDLTAPGREETELPDLMKLIES